VADNPFNTEPAGENEGSEVLFSGRPPPAEQVNSNSPERTRKPRESVARPFSFVAKTFRKYTRENQKVLRGNNKKGRGGSLRCQTCRLRHGKV
jgi:hypothetical protein